MLAAIKAMIISGGWLAYWTVTGLLLLITGTLLVTLTTQTLRLPASSQVSMSVPYNTLQCATSLSQAMPVESLYLYVFSSRGAQRFLDGLCNAAVLGDRYGDITVQWQHESMASVRPVVGQGFDLFVARPDLVDARVVTAAGYQGIVAYPASRPVMISRMPWASLGETAGQKLRIGLLNTVQSTFGYGIPLRELEQAGVIAHQHDLHYYPRHTELRQALLDGAVDVIGSYWNAEEDQTTFSELHVRHLDPVPGPRWYLRESLLSTPVHCGIQAVLEKQRDASSHSYFSRLTILQSCQ